MKIGILNTCTPEEEIDFNANEFENMRDFLNLTENDFELVEYRVTEGEWPVAKNECDAYLITGSPKGVYDREAWIAELGEFIRACHQQSIKMVGICFGHQILAHSLGGHAEKSEKGWGIGLKPLEITSQQPFMNPPLPHGHFYYCHQDQVMTLPEGAKLLAGSEFCPNGMFVIGDTIFGLQAHPEFTRDVMDKTIDWLDGRDIVPNQTLSDAEASVTQREADNEVMSQWIVNFMAGS